MQTTSHSEDHLSWEEQACACIDRLYLTMLGSSALAKACQDPFDYALKLRTGEVIRFHCAEVYRPGWVHLDVFGPDQQPDKNCLPFKADRGIDVRIEDIVWVMDAPEGS